MLDFWHIALSLKGPSAIVGESGRRIVIPLREDLPRDQAIWRSAKDARRLIQQFNGPTKIDPRREYA